jgi:hypothetical protein
MTDFNQLSRVIHVINLRTIGLILLAGTVLIGAGASTMAMSKDLSAAVSATPETFTELYFREAKQLPEVLPAGSKHTLKFAIVNHEAETVTYNYRATLIEKSGSRVVETGSVTLESGQPVTIPLVFTPGVADSPLMLLVELPDQNLSIHFRSHS